MIGDCDDAAPVRAVDDRDGTERPKSCRSDSGSESEDSMWVRRLKFGNISVKLEEEWGAGIGGTLWEGAVLLARYISCRNTFSPDKWRGARCIELGAGACPVPSVVAAQLGCFRQVVITDIEDCLERLHDNVAANLAAGIVMTNADAAVLTHQPGSSGDGGRISASQQKVPAPAPSAAAESKLRQGQGWDGTTSVQACELDWRGNPTHLQPPFDVVLVADVLYAEELVEPLLNMMRLVSHAHSLIAMAIYIRSEVATARFLELRPQYFSSCTKVPEESFGSPTQPDNIGIFLLRH